MYRTVKHHPGIVISQVGYVKLSACPVKQQPPIVDPSPGPLPRAPPPGTEQIKGCTACSGRLHRLKEVCSVGWMDGSSISAAKYNTIFDLPRPTADPPQGVSTLKRSVAETSTSSTNKEGMWPFINQDFPGHRKVVL